MATHPVPRWPAFLTAGFRPFFGFAALAAAVIVIRTVLVFAGLAESPVGGPIRWHGHEMLFGFVPAAMTGFLLTAIPNWAGTRPVQGAPLLVLALWWVIARGAMWPGHPGLAASAVDALFLPLAAIIATRPLWSSGRVRSWLPAGVFILFGVANLLWHAGVQLGAPGLTDRAIRFATMLIALMIAVIGGRITPAFTRNRMHGAGAAPLPRANDLRDTTAIAASALVAIAELVGPLWAAAIAVPAALLHAVRLAGWRGTWAARDPLLFVLHVGYAWLAAGYAIRATALLGPVWAGAWSLHGILAGAVGTMVLGVMTRATLGHTGQPLRAGPTMTLAFAVLQAGVIARLLAPWTGTVAWIAAGLLWAVAFMLFLARCGHLLLRARPEPRAATTTVSPTPGHRLGRTAG